MGPAAIDLGLLALRMGAGVTFSEPQLERREIGIRRLDDGLRRLVRDGWINIVEAEQKRKSVVVLADERRLDAADVYASDFGPDRILCRPGREWGSRDDEIVIQFDGTPVSSRAVELSGNALDSDLAAGLVHWFSRAGKRVIARGMIDPARELEFAA